ncbi:hypothetical protein KUCAC02_033435 [Chaenocephalus aceratus]|nr:hypothetical protein KUCAC02_033435 [Chaenocephalus aceratus]
MESCFGGKPEREGPVVVDDIKRDLLEEFNALPAQQHVIHECVSIEGPDTVVLRPPAAVNQSPSPRQLRGSPSLRRVRGRYSRGSVRGLVRDVLIGGNCLVFTYGVTNAGKTFTFLGHLVLTCRDTWCSPVGHLVLTCGTPGAHLWTLVLTCGTPGAHLWDTWCSPVGTWCSPVEHLETWVLQLEDTWCSPVRTPWCSPVGHLVLTFGTPGCSPVGPPGGHLWDTWCSPVGHLCSPVGHLVLTCEHLVLTCGTPGAHLWDTWCHLWDTWCSPVGTPGAHLWNTWCSPVNTWCSPVGHLVLSWRTPASRGGLPPQRPEASALQGLHRLTGEQQAAESSSKRSLLRPAQRESDVWKINFPRRTDSSSSEDSFCLDVDSNVPGGGQQRRTALRLSQDVKGNSFIKDLRWVQASSSEEACRVMKIGRKNQSFSSTRLNSLSSRSHSIFSIRVLRIADAGVPRVLGISEIQHHVPFRESKLTHFLQFFFCGAGRVSMVVNISRNSACFDETLNVLKFSALAQKVVLLSSKPPPVDGAPHSCDGEAALRLLLEAEIREEVSSEFMELYNTMKKDYR